MTIFDYQTNKIDPDGDVTPPVRMIVQTFDDDADRVAVEMYEPGNPDSVIVFEWTPKKVYR